jgi:hypothetical protein
MLLASWGLMFGQVVFVDLLRRLAIPNTVSPKIMPAMMDSHGNAGMAGIASGVVSEEATTAVVVFLEVVVMEFWAVVVPGLTVEVTAWDEELVAEVAGLEVVAALLLDVLVAVFDVVAVLVAGAVVDVLGAVVVVVAVLPLTPPGGSRWRMRLRESAKGAVTPVPTANPLVADLKERLVRAPVAPPNVMGGKSGTTPHVLVELS